MNDVLAQSPDNNWNKDRLRSAIKAKLLSQFCPTIAEQATQAALEELEQQLKAGKTAALRDHYQTIARDYAINLIRNGIKSKLATQFCPSVAEQATEIVMEEIERQLNAGKVAASLESYEKPSRDHAFNLIRDGLKPRLMSEFDATIAEDATQDALLKIWKLIEEGQIADSFGFYQTIGRNCALDLARKNATQNRVVMNAAATILADLERAEAEASREAEIRDEAKAVWREVKAELLKRERAAGEGEIDITIAILKINYCLTFQEIAAKLDMTEGQVHTAWTRILRRLNNSVILRRFKSNER